MNGILKNRFYLYMTEFIAGISVMAVELGASRLLAPYFSSSQIVWTIIIGTIMIAMALGNVYGGRTADKNPNPDKLYGRLLLAAVWIAAIPVLGKLVIEGGEQDADRCKPLLSVYDFQFGYACFRIVAVIDDDD